ncbi:MAG TPA: porin [Candidatus Aquabacterium excrementipullorum]|nr:porin [Candidatus Aquabacterium excrementipullorum]
MKKFRVLPFCSLTPLALLALATFASSAQAQSQPSSQPSSQLTLYGNIDTAVLWSSNTNAQGQSLTSVGSGGYQLSVWGLMGQEDLGGGLKAFFRLENSFNADTGAVSLSSSFFNRFAVLGLRSDDWGAVSLGRLGSIGFDYTVLGYDLTNLDTYGIAALGAVPFVNLKINNAVKYETPRLGGVRATLMTSTGQEAAEASSAGRYTGLAIEYASGAFKTRLTHEVTHGSYATTLDQSGLQDKRSTLAARYDLGSYAFYGEAAWITGDLHLTPRGRLLQGGVSWRPSPSWTLIGEAGVYDYSDSDGRPTLSHLVAQYHFSKRTMLYAFGTYVDNHGGSRVSTLFAAGAAAPVAGQSQSTVGLGLAHRF